MSFDLSSAQVGRTSDESLPMNVLVGDPVRGYIDCYVEFAALHLAVVRRCDLSRLGPEWDGPGTYVLLDLIDPSDGTWGCYVGKAPAGVRHRLYEHNRKKDHWYRALLIRRDTTFGFNSAQVGWLEGRLYDLMDAAGDAKLHNSVRPVDETLPPFERVALEASILPISRVLFLLGHDASTPDAETTVVGTGRAADKKRRFFNIGLRQLVDAGLLPAGTHLSSTNAKWPATCRVTADGSLESDGRVEAKPSAAAATFSGIETANGWSFWAMNTEDGLVTLATLRARFADSPQGTALSEFE